MSRTLTAAALTAIAQPGVRPVVFYEGQFESAGSPSLDWLRLWSGVGTYTWDGKAWTAAGQLLGIQPIEETSDLQAVGFTVSLSADASAILALAIGYARQGLQGKVWIGFLDNTGALIVDPYVAFSGRFDTPEVVDDGVTATVAANYESRAIDLERARVRRYTSKDQQVDYPSDLGFDFVPSLQDVSIVWGR